MKQRRDRPPPTGSPTKPDPGKQDLVFEEVVVAHLEALYRTAGRLVGNAAEAEEVVQETLIRALRYWDDLRDPERVAPWLFRILHRTGLNHRRHLGGRWELRVDDLSSAEFETALVRWHGSAPPDVLAGREADLGRLSAAIDQLPAAWREVFWLIDVEGFCYSEVTAMLDLPSGTVASRFFRARQQLREALAPAGQRRA